MGKRTHLAFVASVATVCLEAWPALAQPSVSKHTYTYKTVGGLELRADVYHPAGDQVTPAIVWIHGGALVTGRRDNIRGYQLQRYLDSGYALVAIDYRLAPETK